MRGDSLARRAAARAGAVALGVGVVGVLALPARTLATTANDVCPSNADPCVVSTSVPIETGSLLDFGNRELRLVPNGALDVMGGTMTVRGRLLTIQALGSLRARAAASSNPGGAIIAEFAEADIAGTIDVSGAPAGGVTLTVQGALQISGSVVARATLPSEVGGQIDLVAGSATIGGTLNALGGPESIGGDVSVSTAGALILSGTIDASGGDGGGIDVDAGSGIGNAGDLTVTAAALLNANSTTAGSFGGTVDLAATGDNLTSGRIFVDGDLTATGRTGTEETGGGDGGCIALSASGDIRVADAGALLDVNGGGPDGSGGEIDVSTIAGEIEVRGTARAQGPGFESGGGSVSLDAVGQAIVAGALLAGSGGDGGGGEITIASSDAGVLIEASAALDASAGTGGQGGSICLESGFGPGNAARSIAIEGDLSANGGSGSAGGAIEISGGDSVRLGAMGSIAAAGGAAGGVGGVVSIAVDEGSALIDGPITASGGSASGVGGTIAIDASQRVVANAQLDVRASGTGGTIGLSAIGDVDVRRPVLVASSGAAGGTVEIVSQGQVLIGALVNADGSSAAGRTEMLGCEVTVCGMDAPVCLGGGTGILSSLGPNGVNRIIGRDGSFVFGTMRADLLTGRNELVHNGDDESEPFFSLGTITPGAAVVVDAGVRRCPVCGDRDAELPETCDDGNLLDGDGCSADCQLEGPILLGDVNRDSILSPADREFLVNEIFDDDGDGVGRVSGGTFFGGPGADANQDGVITAADFVAIAELLGAP